MGRFSPLVLSFIFSAGSLNAFYTSPKNNNSSIEGQSSPIKKKYTNCEIRRGDLLYWVPEASGLDICFGGGTVLRSTVNGTSTTTSKETDVDPSFDWNVGYRVVLGRQFGSNGWEVGASWTDFQGHGHKPIDHGKWKVELMQLDLTTLYNACINSSVTLQPFIGLRGTSIFQKLFSKIITKYVIEGAGTAIDTRTLRDRQQFYGLGPLFGLNVDWDIKYGLGFYATISSSLLYGNYHLHFNDTEVITPPATPRKMKMKIKKNMSAFDLGIDLALGIQWQYLIRNACYLTLKLGLENHQYFNQSRLGRNFGDLSFSGGIFSFGLAY